jgi:hypothetical protein
LFKRRRGRPAKHVSRVGGLVTVRKYVDDWEDANIADKTISNYLNKVTSGIKMSIKKAASLPSSG